MRKIIYFLFIFIRLECFVFLGFYWFVRMNFHSKNNVFYAINAGFGNGEI